MPNFTTPEPITVIVDASAGNIDVVAADRGDTVVEVRPANAALRTDVEAAENTKVEYADGQLHITVPRQPKLASKVRTVDITIQLPSDSTVRGHVALGEFTVKGRLAECEFDSASGNLTIDSAASVDLKTSLGDIVVGRVTGSASAKVSKGNVRIIEAATGTVNAKVSYGHIDIGVSRDSGVRLTTQTRLGNVTNSLDDGAGQPRTQTVAIDVSTAYGDIAIHRSAGNTTVVNG